MTDPIPDPDAQSRATLYRWSTLAKEQLRPDLARRVVSTSHVMLAHLHLDKGAVVQRHAHENEQLTYVLEGILRFWLGNDESESVDVQAGDVLYIPGRLPHKAEALEQTLDLDIFYPPRADWLSGDDAYLCSIVPP